MKSNIKIVVISFLTMFTVSTLFSCENKSTKDSENATEQLEKQEMQNENTEKERIILKKSREAGRELARRDCEKCFNEAVRYFDTKSSITPIMEQNKAKWKENDEVIFRNANKYDVTSDLLEKMVIEYRQGFDEGWNDMFEYYCNKQ